MPVDEHSSPFQGAVGLVLIVLSVVVPNVVLLYCFSAVDPAIGLEVYGVVSSSNVGMLGYAVIAGAFFIFACLYVCNWPEFGKTFQIITALLPWSILMLGCVLIGRSYPYLPMIMSVFHIGLFLGLLRWTICDESVLGRKTFYWTASAAAFVCAVAMGGLFVAWIWGADKQWSESTRAEFASESTELYGNIYSAMPLNFTAHCGPDKDITEFTSEAQVDIKTGCTAANTVLFLIWAAPFGSCFANLVIGMFVLLAGAPVKDSTPQSLDLEIDRFVKKFIIPLMLVVMGLYASSYFNGVSVRLSGVFAAFFVMFLIFVLAWMNLEFGQQQLHRKFKEVEEEVRKKFSFVPSWFMNVAKALLVWGFNILIPVLIGMDILRQRVRKSTGVGRQEEGFLTPQGEQIRSMLQPWNWSNTLWWVCVVGEAYFTFQFGFSKLTTVFLSWLNETLQPVSFGLIIIVNFFVGAAMFLAPPVPGIAVYLFTGILVAASANNEANKDSIGFAMGCLIAIGLCFALKMAACCGQYAIGYYAGKSVRVQALVGVDKVIFRAIMKILERPGLDIGKVAILIGGPDWPVSVGCGIARLNIPQMLLGTAPVIFLVAPTVLAGAYLGQATPGESSQETVLATVLTGLATLMQLCSGVVASYFFAQVAVAYKEELEAPREEHAAVEQLARDEAELQRAFKIATEWENVPGVLKPVIISAALLVMVSFPFFAFCKDCFQNFCIPCKISDGLEENGLDGDVFNLITYPSGYLALALFFAGVFLHLVWIQATKVLARKQLRLMQQSGQGAVGGDGASPFSVSEGGGGLRCSIGVHVDWNQAKMLEPPCRRRHAW